MGIESPSHRVKTHPALSYSLLGCSRCREQSTQGVREGPAARPGDPTSGERRPVLNRPCNGGSGFMRLSQPIRLFALSLGLAAIAGCENSGPQAVKTSGPAAPAAPAPAANATESFKTPSGKAIQGQQPSPPPGG